MNIKMAWEFKRLTLLLVFFLGGINLLNAQIEDPVEWNISIQETGESTFEINAKCTIEDNWHVYASKISDDPDAMGPIPTSFYFPDSTGFDIIGGLKEGEYITHFDPNFEMDLNYFENEATFSQEIKITDPNAMVKGEMNYMACDDSKCIFPDPVYLEFSFANGKLAYASVNDEVVQGEKASDGGDEIFEPAQWSISSTNNGDGSFTLEWTCTLEEGWHVYSQHLDNNEGPVPTYFQYTLPAGITAEGPTNEEEPIVHYDPNFMMDLAYFENAPKFTQVIKGDLPSEKIMASVDFMVCNDEMCLPPELIEFEVNLQTGVGNRPGELEAGGNDVAKIIPALPNLDLDNPHGDCVGLAASGAEGASKEGQMDNSENEINASTSAWKVFLFGFLGGLVALLTPCVFPMIPLTVSFFTKGGEDKSSGIGKALLYGFFIFLIYALLSIPFHFGTDPAALNEIATSVTLNLIFFVVFVVFAISFFGFFEIRLPASLLNKADSASNVGGLAGIFFMALTLALVSFSCTGPILGTVLGNSLKNGPWPITAAMSGFGIALGLPFAVFAAFPSMMNSLPRSGGWLNSVKVVLGFIELALAVKFLSNADLVHQWHIVERETFFLIWTTLGIGLVLYLLGLIRFPHDSKIKKFSISRIGFIALFASFVIYIAPGIMENPPWRHDYLAGMPPPTFYSWYSEGSEHFDNFEDAMARAEEINKPILVDFTGWACVNCRKMEETVWTDPLVKETIENDFILVSLYVDDKNELPEAQQGVFEFQVGDKTRSKRVKTIGNKWATFQTHYFRNNSQPYYVMLSPEGELLGKPVGYTPDIEEYASYLECGIATNEKLSGGSKESFPLASE